MMTIEQCLFAWNPEWCGGLTEGRKIATCLPQIKDGTAFLPTAPGLGMELKPDVMKREDAIIKES